MATSRVEAFSLTHAQVLDGTQAFLAASLASGTAADDLDIYGVNDASMTPNLDRYENEGDDDVLSRWIWLNYAEIAVQSGYLSMPLYARLSDQTIDTSGAVAAVNEVQTITMTATGGTFTITHGGQTTSAIPYNDSNANVLAALLALSTLDTGDVAVTGAAGTYTLTFGADYAATDVPMVTLGVGSLTGGTATVVETTKGAPASSDVYGLDLWHEDSMNTPPLPAILKMPSKDEDGVVRTLTIGLYKVQFEPITFEGPKYKDGLKVNWNGTALKSAKDELGVAFPDGRKRVGKLLSHSG